MRVPSSIACLSFVLVLLACGGSTTPEPSAGTPAETGSPGSAAVRGTAPQFTAIARYTKNQKQSAPSLVIDVADTAFDCSGPPSGTKFVSISLQGDAVAPGTYSVTQEQAPSKAFVAYLESAGGGAVRSFEGSDSGTVTVTKTFAASDDPNTASVTGSYDIVFADRHLTGTFDARGCASSLNQLVPGSP